MSYNNKAIRLAAILDRIDSEGAALTTDPITAHANRKRLIQDEANRRMEMDEYLRTCILNGSSNYWTYLQAIAALEDDINTKYRLSDSELNMFAEDVADLVDAGIPGLTIGDEFRNTARVILRVIYNDDWKTFLEDMIDKFGITRKS